MRWRIDNPNAEKHINDYERFGQEVPESLIAPALHDIEWSIWFAFWELSSDRQTGMTAGPIPLASIAQYGSDNTGIELSVFTQIIRTMDSEYLSQGSNEGKAFTREMLKG